MFKHHKRVNTDDNLKGFLFCNHKSDASLCSFCLSISLFELWIILWNGYNVEGEVYESFETQKHFTEMLFLHQQESYKYRHNFIVRPTAVYHIRRMSSELLFISGSWTAAIWQGSWTFSCSVTIFWVSNITHSPE